MATCQHEPRSSSTSQINSIQSHVRNSSTSSASTSRSSYHSPHFSTVTRPLFTINGTTDHGATSKCMKVSRRVAHFLHFSRRSSWHVSLHPSTHSYVNAPRHASLLAITVMTAMAEYHTFFLTLMTFRPVYTYPTWNSYATKFVQTVHYLDAS